MENKPPKTVMMNRSPPHIRTGSIRKGLTMIEILIVIALLGLFAVILYPEIMNSLETRSLENAARDVQTTMQRAKFQAVKTKMDHRIRFVHPDFRAFYIERETSAGNWSRMSGFINKNIPPKFNLVVTFPVITGSTDRAVEFSPLGFMVNFAVGQNSIVMQSDKLTGAQPDMRVISVFAGGSIQYTKQ